MPPLSAVAGTVADLVTASRLKLLPRSVDGLACEGALGLSDA